MNIGRYSLGACSQRVC
ncbi:hypothetical protein HU200_064914 [Digitaria exilis]|uniref:Uncharacterized protein n=1 Tax=Digitaria exilis TaxID=1010633 RepID=A0A835A2Q8_9POAL|nr:hypothetical protein HU200_064914 [Digitaria exilis]